MHEIFTERFASKTRDEWSEIFAGTDACVTPVLTWTEAARKRAPERAVHGDRQSTASSRPRRHRGSPARPPAPSAHRRSPPPGSTKSAGNSRLAVEPLRGPGVTRFANMAVRASREVVFDAPAEAILDVLADIDAVPSWSALHRAPRCLTATLTAGRTT